MAATEQRGDLLEGDEDIAPDYDLNVDADLIPTDRYTPLRFLGQGALGQVFLCDDQRLRKRVAIKSLTALTDDRVVAFQKEAKIACRLNHENVIKVFDFGTASGGRPFMVMEYFKGESLQTVLEKRGKFDEHEARIIFLSVAEALAHLHRHGVFHRDLKPSNILLRWDDPHNLSLRLIDFGLSQSTQDVQSRTTIQGRTVVGTPFYMSPDQVNGLPYDATSEVYSLGCIMYEALCGSPPFVGETALDILCQHEKSDCPQLSKRAPHLSDDIVRTVEKCLRKARAERYQNMKELIEALSIEPVLLDHEQSGDDSQEHRTKGRTKSWSWAIAAAFVYIAAIAVLVITLVPSERTPRIQDGTVSSTVIPLRSTGDILAEAKLETRKRLMATLKAGGAQARNIYGKFDCTNDCLELLANNQSVELLNVSESPLDDSCLPIVAKIPNLEYLDLSLTYVETLKDIDSIKSLRTLVLKGTAISDSALDNLKSMKLERLILSSCTEITEAGIEKLSALEHLKSLDMSRTKIAGAAVPALKKMKRLETIDLRETNLTMPDVETLAGALPQLRELFITANPSEYERLGNKYPAVQFDIGKLSVQNQLLEVSERLHRKGEYALCLKALDRFIANEKQPDRSPQVASVRMIQLSVYAKLKDRKRMKETSRALKKLSKNLAGEYPEKAHQIELLLKQVK